MLELAFRADSRQVEPVYRQLERHLRGLLSSGRLLPGEKLPATRELAQQLDLSRNTVIHAYRNLQGEGVLTGHVGQGTFVAPGSPLVRGGHEADEAGRRGFVWDGLVSRRAPSSWPPPRVVVAPRGGPPRFDFRGGRVDPETLPLQEWRRVWSRVLGEQLARLANPGDPLGWPPLREEIARSLLARGIRCDTDQVLVVSGAQQALDLVARVLLDPGDIVAMEQPGYFGAAQVFRAYGAQLASVPVDRQGLCTDDLARLLHSRRVKLVYATPSAQFPTGALLSEPRRRALHALSDLHQVPIFEDDYDAELRFESPPLPALKARDPSGRVVYAGTFSKATFPGLRLGYVVAARPLLSRLVTARLFADFGSDVVSQAAIAELLRSGSLERHVRRLRAHYAERRDAMLAALDESMPAGVEWTRPQGGHTIWLTLPAAVDPDALAVAAAQQGLAYVRGEAYSLDESGHACLALAFVNQPVEILREGIATLSALIRRQHKGRKSS